MLLFSYRKDKDEMFFINRNLQLVYSAKLMKRFLAV